MPLLLPFSWLYGAAVWLRNRCYDRGIFRVVHVDKPVIAVGNLTTGGTGKTPLTEYIVKYCSDKKRRVAILSRGYKRTTSGTLVVSDGKNILVQVEEAGDEPYQMANKFPDAVVIVDEHRSRGAQMAVQSYGADMIILDDAFQHRSIHRDIDIVTIDGTRPLHREPMLPAGRRREQLSSLSRADVIVVSGKGEGLTPSVGVQNDESVPILAMKLIPQQLRRLSDGSTVALETINGMSCLAVCGIGNPDSFKSSLKEMKVEVKEFLPFPDHHRFQLSDVEKIQSLFRNAGADIIVTTEKDAVRLQASSHKLFLPLEKMFALIVKAEITDDKRIFLDKIDELLRSNEP